MFFGGTDPGASLLRLKELRTAYVSRSARDGVYETGAKATNAYTPGNHTAASEAVKTSVYANHDQPVVDAKLALELLKLSKPAGNTTLAAVFDPVSHYHRMTGGAPEGAWAAEWNCLIAPKELPHEEL